MREFTIKRSEWDRGERFQDERKKKRRLVVVALKHRQDGKKCCIGFYLEACGVEINGLPDAADVANQKTVLPEEAQWLVRTEPTDPDYQQEALGFSRFDWDNSDEGKALMDVNDDNQLTEYKRELEIKKLFHGYADVKFED